MIRNRSMRFVARPSATSWNFLLVPGCDDLYKLEEKTTAALSRFSAWPMTLFQGGTGEVYEAFVHPQLDGLLPALVEAGGENAQSRFVAQKILGTVGKRASR